MTNHERILTSKSRKSVTRMSFDQPGSPRRGQTNLNQFGFKSSTNPTPARKEAEISGIAMSAITVFQKLACFAIANAIYHYGILKNLNRLISLICIYSIRNEIRIRHQYVQDWNQLWLPFLNSLFVRYLHKCNWASFLECPLWGRYLEQRSIYLQGIKTLCCFFLGFLFFDPCSL